VSVQLCSTDDVTSRPELVGRTLTDDDEAKIEGYIGDASVLIEGYNGRRASAALFCASLQATCSNNGLLLRVGRHSDQS
jgi:hypothetical protein